MYKNVGHSGLFSTVLSSVLYIVAIALLEMYDEHGYVVLPAHQVSDATRFRYYNVNDQRTFPFSSGLEEVKLRPIPPHGYSTCITIMTIAGRFSQLFSR